MSLRMHVAELGRLNIYFISAVLRTRYFDPWYCLRVFAIFCVEAFARFCETILVRQMVVQTEAGTIFPMGMSAHSARGDA